MRIIFGRVIGVFGIIMLIAGAILLSLWVNYDRTHTPQEKKYKDECTGKENQLRRANDTAYNDYCQDISPGDPLGGLAAVILGFCGIVLLMPAIGMVVLWVLMEHRESRMRQGPPPYYQPGPWPPPPPPQG